MSGLQDATKYRSTFLFQLLILLGSVVVFIGVVLPFLFLVFGAVGVFSLPIALLILGAILFIWVIGIEGGLIVTVVERMMLRRYRRLNQTPSAVLFYVDNSKQREWASHTKDTKDNPTIR